MNEKKISIILPVYNGAEYLAESIESILNQTYAHLEIVLVDDGSPDGCPQICDEYATTDKRIVVIHKENGGLSDARNVGTKKAVGDYVYYLDSDDEIPLDSIETMVEYSKMYPKAEIIVGKMQCPQKPAMYRDQLFGALCVFNNNLEFQKTFFCNSNRIPVNACNKLILKKFLITNNLFFKKDLIYEDQFWMFHISQIVSCVLSISQVTYVRHLNLGSITTGSSNQKTINSWGVILKEIFPLINPPFFAEKFFRYYNQLNKVLPLVNEDQIKLYKEVCANCIACAKRNNSLLLALFLTLHIKLFKFLKGHGTGFAIWALLKTSQRKSNYFNSKMS